MRKFKLFGRTRKLGKRYGRAAGKRKEGVKVQREPGRLYYVAKSGEVMSTGMRNH